MKRIIFITFILFLLIGCKSLPYTADREDVDIVVGLINNADVKSLVAASRLPFLFDSEIINSPSDIEYLWQSLAENGFKLTNYTIKEIFVPDDLSSLWTGLDMEIDSYKKNYLNQDSNCVILDTDKGEFLLLIGRPVKGIPSILGIRGPAL